MSDIFNNLKDIIISADREILKFINIKLYNKYFALLIRFISNDIFLITVLVFMFLWYFIKVKKITYQDKINLLLLLWGLILVNITNTLLLKPFFKRPRPSVALPDIILLSELKKPGYAFPSTHTAMATFFVLLLWNDYEKLRPFLFLFLIAMCFFCVYTGGHYPLDVASGLILGWLFFLAVNFIKNFLLNKGI